MTVPSALSGQIAAIVVAYFPDAKRLNHLIGTLLGQGSTVIVYDNGNARDQVVEKPNVHILGNGQNVGIAYALNRGTEYAISNGAEYVATFDQDSCPPEHMLSDLRKHLDKGRNRRVVAVGPVCYDVRGAKYTWPVFTPGRYGFKKVNPDGWSAPIPSIFLITSGMMFCADGYLSVGPFDESLFIDHVDTAWGLRANAANMTMLTCPDVRMKHELSRSAPRFFLGRLVLDYPPVRRYFTARNSIRLALSGFVPIGLRLYYVVTTLYRLVVIPIFDESPKESFNASLRGIWHGIRQGRLMSNGNLSTHKSTARHADSWIRRK